MSVSGILATVGVLVAIHMKARQVLGNTRVRHISPFLKGANPSFSRFTVSLWPLKESSQEPRKFIPPPMASVACAHVVS